MHRAVIRAAWGGVALAVALGQSLAGQALRPLSKSDLIRMLTSPAFPVSEVAAVVQRNCTSFTPSDRDREDLRAVGATDDMLRSIDRCRAAAEMLRLRVPAAEVAVEAGDLAAVWVELRRGDTPAAGVELLLVGSGRTGAGSGEDARATTDARGVATFRVQAGTRIANYPLSVAAISGEPLSGSTAMTLVVQPAGRIRTEVQPRRVEFRTGEVAQSVQIGLRDALGNAVPAQRVELVPADGGPPFARLSDGRGTVTFDLAADGYPRPTRLIVRVGGRVVDSLDVLPPAGASPARTGFVAGHGQRGRVGTTLAQPLVFEVRDTANVGLPNRTVVITAHNATPEADTVRTDGNGRVVLRVRLGERAGPAAVIARVGDIERQAALLALPGPARRLRLSCGHELGSRVVLAADTTAVVVLTAVDPFDNALPLTGARVTVGDQRLARVETVRADSARVRITLRGRTPGSTNLAVLAGGLRENFVLAVQPLGSPDACVGGR